MWNDIKPICGFTTHVLPLVYDNALTDLEKMAQIQRAVNLLVQNNNSLPDFIEQLINDMISGGVIGDSVKDIISKWILNVKYAPSGVTSAVGDGTEDDTIALKECISYAKDHDLALFFPAGVYLTSELDIPSNMCLYGSGINATKLVLKSGAMNPFLYDTIETINITIADMELDANGGNQVRDINVCEFTGTNYIFQNVRFSNGYKGLKIHGNGGTVEIYNSEIIDFTNVALELLQEASTTLAHVINLRFSRSSSSAFDYHIINNYNNSIFTGLFCDDEILLNNNGTHCIFEANVNLNDSNIETFTNTYISGGQIINTGDTTLKNVKSTGQAIFEDTVTIEKQFKYLTPTMIDNSLKYVPFTGADGKTYNLLVQGDSGISGVGVSVKEYGAVGDGVADDLQAFNTWINDLAKNGWTGYIPSGTYRISGEIKCHQENNKKWSIVGESKETVVIKQDFISLDAQPHILNIAEQDGFSVNNLTLMCPGRDLMTSGVAIYMYDNRNGVIKNIDITQCSRGAVLCYTSKKDSSNYNLVFDNINVYGVVNNAPFDNDLTEYLYPMGFILEGMLSCIIENCSIYNIAWYGYELKNKCINTIVRNCRAFNSVDMCHIGNDLDDHTPINSCGFYNMVAYNVDKPITGGRIDNCVFSEIKCYYNSPYSWQSKNTSKIQPSINLQYLSNSFINCEIFNAPYGGIVLQDNSINNYVRFNMFTRGSSFTSRPYLFDETSINNIIECSAHKLSETFLITANDSAKGNLIIDSCLNRRINCLNDANNRREYTYNNNYGIGGLGDTTYNGQAVQRVCASLNNIVKETYGIIAGKYITVEYNTNDDNPYIDFKLQGGNNPKTIRIDDTGAHVL